MNWERKSNVSEMYCAVHNVDCPLHGHDGDPWVLAVDPHKTPDSWICPEAVQEITVFEDSAQDRKEQNAAMVDHER